MNTLGWIFVLLVAGLVCATIPVLLCLPRPRHAVTWRTPADRRATGRYLRFPVDAAPARRPQHARRPDAPAAQPEQTVG
jgi:hypothetical protein